VSTHELSTLRASRSNTANSCDYDSSTTLGSDFWLRLSDDRSSAPHEMYMRRGVGSLMVKHCFCLSDELADITRASVLGLDHGCLMTVAVRLVRWVHERVCCVEELSERLCLLKKGVECHTRPTLLRMAVSRIDVRW
jgi:hypothetical protein